MIYHPQNRLFQLRHGHVVHVGKGLVFAYHSPYEGIVRCAHAGMDRPAWRYNCLLISHYHMPGLFRLAEEMKDKGIFRHLEIAIYFHAAVMSMARHGVPDTAFLELGKTHHELTALEHARMNTLENLPLVGAFHSSEHHLLRLILRDFCCRVCRMGGCGIKIKLCRIRALGALEGNFPSPHAYIKALFPF